MPANRSAALIVSSCGSEDDTSGKGASASETFIEAYRKAHGSKDVEAAMKLAWKEGMDETVERSLSSLFESDFESGILDIRIEPASFQQLTPEVTMKGTTYRMNLKVEGWLVVKLEPPSADVEGTHSTQIPLGKKDGAYYFSVRIPVPN